MHKVLLINPWITDVAAFDMWAWPLGLLYWAGHLRENGAAVRLIDCTDRWHSGLSKPGGVVRNFGTGKYHSELFDFQPEPVKRAGRRFRRYGLPPEAFEKELRYVEDEWPGGPDAVLVTSRMTYWYHGVADAIARCRRAWPDVPILLGGNYATLAPDHARRHSGASEVLLGNALEELPKRLSELLGMRLPAMSANPEEWPRPAFDLCHSRAALPVMTSLGCPYSCTYCASKKLWPRYVRRSFESVFEEMSDAAREWGTRDFAFYDDALLVDAGRFAQPLMRRIAREGLGVRLHVPNGMHYQLIDAALAGDMKSAGVETIRLSLESVEAERLQSWNRAGDPEAFRRSVAALLEAGYERGQIGVYLMAGMPGQGVEEVARAIEFVKSAGATPKLNEYSPIPGTGEWQEALRLSGGEIEEEPLWQNNSLYYTRGDTGFTQEDFQRLKDLANEI